MSISSSVVGGKIKYKIVLLGDQHVGKTSIIDRFIHDRFQLTYNATIGIDFLVRNLTYQNKTYRLQLWDTAGQERFKSLIPSYLKDSNLCILVYDVGNLQSLQNIQKWMELYNQHKEYTAFCVIVGNKADSATKQCTKQIVEDKLRHYNDVHRFEISAKTGEGVVELFNSVVQLITNRLNNIKIIDQIDEKQQKASVNKSQNAESVKPIIEEQFTSIKLDSKKQQESLANKRRCC